jgi:predicted PurR-regulated permease PerM
MSGQNVFQIFLLLVILALLVLLIAGAYMAYTQLSPVLDTANKLSGQINTIADKISADITEKVNSVSQQLEGDIMDALKKAGISPQTISLIGTMVPSLLSTLNNINTDVSAIYDKVVKTTTPQKEGFGYYQYQYVPTCNGKTF